MKILLVFATTCLMSALGSLQLGPVNLAVIRAAIGRSLKDALWIALGGCLPELLYSYLALRGVMWFEQHPSVLHALQWLVVPILLVVGLVTFSKAPSAQAPPRGVSRRASLVQGLSLAMLNPQLLAFWTVVLLQFQQSEPLRLGTSLEQAAFVLGTACGAAGILGVFAALAHRYRAQVLQRLSTQRLNQVVGGLFVLLALIQLGKLLGPKLW